MMVERTETMTLESGKEIEYYILKEDEELMHKKVVLPFGVLSVIMSKVTSLDYENYKLKKALIEVNEFLRHDNKEDLIDEIRNKNDYFRYVFLSSFSLEKLEKINSLLQNFKGSVNK